MNKDKTNYVSNYKRRFVFLGNEQKKASVSYTEQNKIIKKFPFGFFQLFFVSKRTKSLSNL